MIIIGQISDRKIYEEHFGITFQGNQTFHPSYFIERLQKALVVNQQRQPVFMEFNYGMVPFWSRKPIMHFESPVEGSENPGSERLKKRIIIHPSFRRPIRENRCLIPADFIIAPNETGEPYMIFAETGKIFTLAGIYDNWKETFELREMYQGFSILTIPSGAEFRDAGINRLPVILSERFYKKWLDPDAPLAEITRLMEMPGGKKLNGYPVSKKLYLEKCNNREICNPTGERIRKVEDEKKKIGNFIRSFRFGKWGSWADPA